MAARKIGVKNAFSIFKFQKRAVVVKNFVLTPSVAGDNSVTAIIKGVDP